MPKQAHHYHSPQWMSFDVASCRHLTNDTFTATYHFMSQLARFDSVSCAMKYFSYSIATITLFKIFIYTYVTYFLYNIFSFSYPYPTKRDRYKQVFHHVVIKIMRVYSPRGRTKPLRSIPDANFLVKIVRKTRKALNHRLQFADNPRFIGCEGSCGTPPASCRFMAYPNQGIPSKPILEDPLVHA
jgi:hypothetical protein